MTTLTNGAVVLLTKAANGDNTLLTHFEAITSYSPTLVDQLNAFAAAATAAGTAGFEVTSSSAPAAQYTGNPSLPLIDIFAAPGAIPVNNATPDVYDAGTSVPNGTSDYGTFLIGTLSHELGHHTAGGGKSGADGNRMSPSSDSANSADNQHDESAYVARVSLAQTDIDTEQGRLPLEPGMSVTAEIKTGQRRVIDYLMSPLMRYQHEGLRER